MSITPLTKEQTYCLTNLIKQPEKPQQSVYFIEGKPLYDTFESENESEKNENYTFDNIDSFVRQR